MSHIEHDDHSNNLLSTPSDFSKIIDNSLSRRRFLQTTAAGSSIAFFATSPLANAMTKKHSDSTVIGFNPIAASTSDTVVVPKGYLAQPLIAWGDSIKPKATLFSQTNSATDQEGVDKRLFE